MAAEIATVDDIRSIVREEVRAALRDLAPATAELLTSEQVAAELGVTAQTVQRWTRRQRLDFTERRGNEYRYSRKDVERFRSGDQDGLLKNALASLVKR